MRGSLAPIGFSAAGAAEQSLHRAGHHGLIRGIRAGKRGGHREVDFGAQRVGSVRQVHDAGPWFNWLRQLNPPARNTRALHPLALTRWSGSGTRYRSTSWANRKSSALTSALMRSEYFCAVSLSSWANKKSQ